jgi:hypothetical protein
METMEGWRRGRLGAVGAAVGTARRSGDWGGTSVLRTGVCAAEPKHGSAHQDGEGSLSQQKGYQRAVGAEGHHLAHRIRSAEKKIQRGTDSGCQRRCDSGCSRGSMTRGIRDGEKSESDQISSGDGRLRCMAREEGARDGSGGGVGADGGGSGQMETEWHWSNRGEGCGSVEVDLGVGGAASNSCVVDCAHLGL